MEFLKELFKNGPLTFEQFSDAVKTAKLNIVNLADGGYVSKGKHEDTVKGLDQQIQQLNAQLQKRDADMATLRGTLEAAQADAGKLPGIQQTLTDLQAKYAQEKKDFETQITRQKYEFAVRERANGLEFSSSAAKKEFIREAIGKDFKMDGDNLLGYEDFVTKYKADDPGAFKPASNPKNPQDPNPTPPQVVLPGGNPAGAGGQGEGLFGFRFTGVRPHGDK